MNTFRRSIRVFCALVTIVVLLVSFTPAVPTIAGQMAADWYQGDADALIILGSGMLVSGTGLNATLDYESYLRCAYAWWNIQQFKYPHIVVTGNDGVAEAMAAFLLEKGVDAGAILIENKADSTFLNAQLTKQILTERVRLPPDSRVALLTSDYHSRRAQLVFEGVFKGTRLHFRVIPVPDLGKQAGSPSARWIGFFMLSTELSKYAFYAVTGRLRT